MRNASLLAAASLALAACSHQGSGEAARAAHSTSSIPPTTPATSSTLMSQSSALEQGRQFLQENQMKEGVKTTASGLQYKVLREGSGKQPAATDVVEVNYEGKLISGTVFDSSYQRGKSIEFPLNRVIPGWTEGVQLMKEGAKYQFYIPSELAYGKSGAGGAIGPDETLIFDVELIKVK